MTKAVWKLNGSIIEEDSIAVVNKMGTVKTLPEKIGTIRYRDLNRIRLNIKLIPGPVSLLDL